MAYYAALVSVVQLLKEIAHPYHPYHKSPLDKQQIHVSLYEKFNLVQELLDDYSPKDHKQESVDNLERRIRDATYRAQDIVESHISNQIRPEDTAEDKPRAIFRHLSSALKKVPRKLQAQRLKGLKFDNTLEKEYYLELEKVKKEVDSIVEELMRIKESSHSTHEEDLQLNSHISEGGDDGAALKAQAPIGKSTIVGLEEQLTTIKGKLCGESSKLEVISIVGMGGLGKSTLARTIFDDKLIDDHFDCRAWEY